MQFDLKKIKEINFSQLIREALTLTWKKKYLWWFGLLSFFGTISQISLPFSKKEEPEKIENFPELLAIIEKNQERILWIGLTVLLIIILFSLLSVFFSWHTNQVYSIRTRRKSGKFPQ